MNIKKLSRVVDSINKKFKVGDSASTSRRVTSLLKRLGVKYYWDADRRAYRLEGPIENIDEVFDKIEKGLPEGASLERETSDVQIWDSKKSHKLGKPVKNGKVGDSVSEQESNEFYDKLCSEWDVTVPDNWTEDDIDNLIISVEDFFLVDSPEPAEVKSDGHHIWIESEVDEMGIPEHPELIFELDTEDKYPELLSAIEERVSEEQAADEEASETDPDDYYMQFMESQWDLGVGVIKWKKELGENYYNEVGYPVEEYFPHGCPVGNVGPVLSGDYYVMAVGLQS